MKKSEKEELESMPFEKLLEKLESIVEKMEGGKIPLEEMMRHFEEGSRIAAVCGEKLKAIEKKIELLVKDDGADGVWKDFDPSSGTRGAAPDKRRPAPEKHAASEDEDDSAGGEEKPKGKGADKDDGGLPF